MGMIGYFFFPTPILRFSIRWDHLVFMADMNSQYWLAIWAYSYGHNRQEIIKGWAGVRGGFNFSILLVMYFYSLIFRAFQLIISDLLLEFYYNDYLFNYHIITYFIY